VYLDYRLEADPAALRLPAAQPRQAMDGLWRHSCCEAFLLGADAPAYREVNLSPSGAWAGYGFSAYRRAAEVPSLPDPGIRLRRDEAVLTLEARVPAAWLPPGRRLRLGLSAVLEHADGRLSYWALSHPPGRPDFHHRDCFLLELERSEESDQLRNLG
jgi:hypothetical protein